MPTMEPHTWQRGEYEVSTDQDRLDLGVIHRYLSEDSYWARGIPRKTVERSVRNSLCFGLYHGDRQIGFARAISDFSTIAYLGDVFVLLDYRSRGLAKWMLECVLLHPDLQNLRRWFLMTRHTQEFYRRFGFRELVRPEGYMELHDPNVYMRSLG
jgi:N-acetylglutamate synthase-like GNAT family acetyltransferase